MNNKKLVVYMTYGDESAVFKRCADNWRAYSNNNQDVDFYIVKDVVEEISSINIGSLVRTGGNDYHYYKPAVNEASTYSKNYTWTPSEMTLINEKHKKIWALLLEKYKDDCTYFYQVNNTAFSCFKTIKRLINYLPNSDFYGGRIILHSPLNFCYVAGSHVLWSRASLVKLYKKVQRESSSIMVDYYWGLNLQEIQRSIIPQVNIASEETAPTAGPLGLLVETLDSLLKLGHFQIRFKNNNHSNYVREDIDPILQWHAMSHSNTKSPEMIDASLRLFFDYQNPNVYTKDIVVLV